MKSKAIRRLSRLISQDFAPNTRTKILESYKVWPWNKLKGCVFNVFRVEGTWISFIVMFLQVLYLPSTTVVKTEYLEQGFLRNFFFNFALSFIGNYDPVSLQILSKKWDLIETEVSNYDKFICNIFGWDTARIGVIRAKVDLTICVCLNRTKPWLELSSINTALDLSRK